MTRVKKKMIKTKMLWKIMRRIHADKLIISFVIGFFLVSLLITLAEPGIHTYGEGLWYSFVACTTIGFGDFVAVTTWGRILTVYLALHEIILLALLPGIIVTYYMEVIHRREKESLTMFLEKLERLPELSKEELEDISKKVKKIK